MQETSITKTMQNRMTKEGAKSLPCYPLCDINTKEYSKGADEFGDVTNNGTRGLINRRQKEIKMFKENIYENNK